MVLLGEVSIGAIYDLVGRKNPVVFSMLLGGVSQILIAYAPNFTLYAIGLSMTIPIVVTSSCPYVPDLIREESQGVAQAMKVLCIDLAGVIGSFFLDLNSRFPVVFSPFNIYFGLGILGLVSAILLHFGMKDIIKMKDWNENMQRISRVSKIRDTKKNRFKFILRQAIYLIFHEPFIFVGMFAGIL